MNPRETPCFGRAFSPGARAERLRLRRAAPPGAVSAPAQLCAGAAGVPLRAARLCRGCRRGAASARICCLTPCAGLPGKDGDGGTDRSPSRCHPVANGGAEPPRAPRCPEPGSTAARGGPPSPSVLPREHRSSPCSVLLCEGRASARECAVVNSHVRRGVAGLLFVHLFHFLSGKDCSRAQFWGSEA